MKFSQLFIHKKTYSSMEKLTNKKTFVFNTEWKEILSEYPPSVRYAVYDAIIDYANTSIVPPMEPLVSMAFAFIKKEMDYNASRYNAVASKRSYAGKQGMQARYNKSNKVMNETTNVTNVTNVTDNENVIVNDNVNVNAVENKNVNDNEKENVNEVASATVPKLIEKKDKPKVITKKASPAAAVAATNERAEQFKKEIEGFANLYTTKVLNEFYNYWSEPNKSKTKMRFELERTWDLTRRLRTWGKRDDEARMKAKYIHPSTNLDNETIDTSGF